MSWYFRPSGSAPDFSPSWPPLTGDWSGWFRAVLASLILGVVFLLLYLVPGQGLGFGDVKLAFLLGLFLGWVGWRAVLLGALLPWLINGPLSSAFYSLAGSGGSRRCR